jgi:hypothetical protein
MNEYTLQIVDAGSDPNPDERLLELLREAKRLGFTLAEVLGKQAQTEHGIIASIEEEHFSGVEVDSCAVRVRPESKLAANISQLASSMGGTARNGMWLIRVQSDSNPYTTDVLGRASGVLGDEEIPL